MNKLPSHSMYYEPFAGGGSIFFAKPKVSINVLNDMDEDLILVYRTLRDHPDELIDFLSRMLPPSKESHVLYKKFVPQTDMERAARWYYLNRISYSGIMKLQNCFWGYGDKFSMRPENWPRAIRSASAKLQDVEITNKDFETVIDNAADGSFLFVDPPYFNADQDKFYTVSFNKDSHARLCDTLRRNSDRLSFLLTYDNCTDIKTLYDWASMETNEWNYCISRSDDQKTKTDVKGTRSKGKEIFIKNYDLLSDPTFIYDPFIGSGSTMLACEKSSRICYGMEIDPAYCDVAIKRMTDARERNHSQHPSCRIKWRSAADGNPLAPTA